MLGEVPCHMEPDRQIAQKAPKDLQPQGQDNMFSLM